MKNIVAKLVYLAISACFVIAIIYNLVQMRKNIKSVKHLLKDLVTQQNNAPIQQQTQQKPCVNVNVNYETNQQQIQPSCNSQYNDNFVIEEKDNIVQFNNQHIGRAFQIQNGTLKTVEFINRRLDNTSTSFRPTPDLLEFQIKLFDKAENENPQVPIVDKTGWTITADSQEKGNPASCILDDDINTYWMSNGDEQSKHPHFFTIDTKSNTQFRSFQYIPHNDLDNGNIVKFQFFAGPQIDKLNLIMKGQFNYDNGFGPKYVNLPKQINARFVRLVALSAFDRSDCSACACFNLCKTEVSPPQYKIITSDLFKFTYQKNVISPTTQQLIFRSSTEKFENFDVSVSIFYQFKDGDFFFRKHIEIQVPTEQHNQFRIDYVDLEHFNINTDTSLWSHPDCNDVSGLPGFIAGAGKPMYVNGLFMGLEFPVAITEINDRLATIRQYSGKSFAELNKENRLTSNTFKTWPSVCGATRSLEIDVMEQDFHSYLSTIQTPCNIRVQYNSWYDWMLNIDEKNIITSFYEMERGLTQAGADTLDSYVVDDGWNEYSDKNKTGFWEWNSKFPSGLAQPKTLVQKLGSNFGLWLGPRGGYSAPAQFAKHIEKFGNGEYNPLSQDICTNHKIYIKKLEEFFIDCQRKYDIVYWKFDGFAYAPCPRINENHITGGKFGIHWMTEHWERYCGVFMNIRKDAQAHGINDLWINLTTFTMPSPWFLQFGNSLWLGNSWDLGKTDIGLKRMVDQCLTYRDGRVYEFSRVRKHQVPLKCVYNHDPIYGKTGSDLQNTMDDDEFRTYVFIIMTRGAALVNLYFSYNMIDEGQKWLVIADCLNWRRKNYHIIKHSKQFGNGDPEKGCIYGYSAWEGAEGIISVRNPKNEQQQYDIVLDRNIGVPENIPGLYRESVMNFRSIKEDDNTKQFKYGDTIALTLQPGEAIIWQFAQQQNVTPPAVKCIKTPTSTLVHTTFQQKVKISKAVVKINNQKYDFILLADRRTLAITVPQMEINKNISLQITDILNYNNVSDSVDMQFQFFANHVINKIDTKQDLANGQSIEQIIDEKFDLPAIVMKGQKYDSLNKVSYAGTHDFNVSLFFNCVQPGTLFAQGQEFSVKITQQMLIEFKINQTILLTKIKIDNSSSHSVSCCRELNGMLKIYVDGILEASVSSLVVQVTNIKQSQVSIGGDGFTGTIGSVKLSNNALNFKENVILFE